MEHDQLLEELALRSRSEYSYVESLAQSVSLYKLAVVPNGLYQAVRSVPEPCYNTPPIYHVTEISCDVTEASSQLSLYLFPTASPYLFTTLLTCISYSLFIIFGDVSLLLTTCLLSALIHSICLYYLLFL